MNISIQRFDSLGSTNDEVIRQAKLGAAEGLCVIARRQTSGRGRQGRVWSSPPDSGLYFSILLRPKLDARFMPLITLMAGVAVCDSLVEFGIRSDVKWVNDVLVDEKKISGILAEAVDAGPGQAVVLGIGMNLSSTNFPDELAGVATSIREVAGQRVSPDEAAEVLTKYLGYFYEVLTAENGPNTMIELWRERSSYFAGKRVTVIEGDETIVGVTDGLEENGALRIRLPDGKLRVVHAGDVQRLRSN